MAEREMVPGQEVVIAERTKAQIGAALNQHIVAKDLAERDIDQLRQHETMQRILNLAKTREGLAALIETSRERS